MADELKRIRFQFHVILCCTAKINSPTSSEKHSRHKMLSGQEKLPQKNRKYLGQHDSEIIPFENSDTDDTMKRKP
jgi:hypothetical protein